MKTFIDCGFHHGEGLKAFIPVLGINSDWRVHCFEANPACQMQNRLLHDYDFIPDGRLTLINIVSHNKAVWTEDGEVNFCQENHFLSESGSPTDGTSVVDGWCSRISDLINFEKSQSSWQPIKVESIDFSKWISQFAHDDVWCKMDIEGAEFQVLRKLLRDGKAGIFKTLWVEFHPYTVPGESLKTKKLLIDQLREFTDVVEWH